MSRNNAPATYVTTGRDADGNLWFQQISNETPFGEPSESNSGNKNIYMEGALNYDRMFGRHTVSGMGLFYQKERQLHNEALAYRKQAYIGRSAELRVGKECVSTCRSRGSPYQYQQQKSMKTD